MYTKRYMPIVVEHSLKKEKPKKFLSKIIEKEHWYVHGDEVCANVKGATVKLRATDDVAYMDLHYNGVIHRFEAKGPTTQYALIYNHYKSKMDTVEKLLNELLRDLEIDTWTVNESKKSNDTKTNLLKACLRRSTQLFTICWNTFVKIMITTASAVNGFLKGIK